MARVNSVVPSGDQVIPAGREVPSGRSRSVPVAVSIRAVRWPCMHSRVEPSGDTSHVFMDRL